MVEVQLKSPISDGLWLCRPEESAAVRVIHDFACRGTVGVLNTGIKAWDSVNAKVAKAVFSAADFMRHVWRQASSKTIFDQPWCLLELVETQQDRSAETLLSHLTSCLVGLKVPQASDCSPIPAPPGFRLQTFCRALMHRAQQPS